VSGFAVGDRVRVRDHVHTGHRRTPYYIRRRTGEVVRVAGRFLNPEQLAYGSTGLPGVTLYRVRFSQRSVWGDAYAGAAADTIDIEVYEHWLEPAVAADT